MYAIYRTNDGLITGFMDAPSDDIIALQCQAGESYLPNCPLTATHVINGWPQSMAPPPVYQSSLDGIKKRCLKILAASDWTQLADSPVDKAAWAAYRSQIRNFPSTCNPNAPLWPVAPATDPADSTMPIPPIT